MHAPIRAAALAMLASAATFSPAWAQTATPTDQGSKTQADRTNPEAGEIVVTATRRSETLQRVPFSIAAQTEAQIRNLGATNIVEFGRNIAGLSIADLGPGQSTVAIRGVSSGQVVRDESSRKESVGVYLDDSVISLALFTPDLELYDLSRVEVLRGPQGTLFGSGSLGGTLRYITNQPNLSRIEGSVELEGTGIEHGSFGGAASGAINLPIITDKIAARAVGYYRHFGGYIDAVDLTGRVVKHDVNDGQRYGGRFAVTLKPTETFSITPRIVYQRLETNSVPREDVSTLFLNPNTTTRPAYTFAPLTQFKQAREGIHDDFVLGDVNANFELGPVTFTSVSSYTDRHVVTFQDSSVLAGQIDEVLIGIPDSAIIPAPLENRTVSKVFTQEFRFASNSKGPFRYVLGAYYFDQNKTYGQRVTVAGFTNLFNSVTGAGLDGRASLPITTVPDVLFTSAFDINVQQIAGFGEATLDLFDRLHLTGGVRYFDYVEHRNAVQTGFYQCGSSLTDCATDPALRRRRTQKDGFTPRAIVALDVAPRVTLNAQASKGFRLGGINDPLITNICADDIASLGGRDIQRFSNESAWNYEVGVKSQFRGVTLNAAAYYVDISDLQVSARLRCSSTITVNVPHSEIQGVEAELSASPSRYFHFGANINYSHSKVLSAVNIPDGFSGQPLIQRGDRLPTAPEFQASANFTVEQPVRSDEYMLYLTGVTQLVGDSYSFLGDQRNNQSLPFGVRYGNPAGAAPLVFFPSRLKSYTISNLRAGIRKGGDWEAALFVNNLFDERAELALDRERGGEGRAAYIVNQPRTYGINLRKNF